MLSSNHSRCGLAAISAHLLATSVVLCVAGEIKFNGVEYLPTGSLPGDQVLPAVAVCAGGGILVWQDNTDGSGLAIRGKLLSSQLSGVFSPFYVNTTFIGDQENVSCIALPSGDYFLTWQSGTRGSQRILGRILGNDGVFRTGEIEISQGTGARSPKAVVNVNATVTIVWTQSGVDSDMDAVVARTINVAGTPMAPPVQVNVSEPYNQRDPVAVSLDDGSLFVAWISENPFGAPASTAVGRKLDKDLSPVSGEIGLTSGKNPCATPIVVKLSDRLLLAWSEFQLDTPENGWDLLAKPITFSGAPLGIARRITANQQGDQGDLSLAFNGDKVIAAFTSGSLDGSGLGIGIQELNVDGVPTELDIVVNSTKRQNQVRPALALNPSGSGLVVWVGFGSVESGVDLFAQRVGRSDPELSLPSAPVVIALSSSKIRVGCPDAAGLPVAKFLIYLDDSLTPLESTAPYVTLSGLAPESQHSISVAFMLQDGRISPKSDPKTITTWSEDDNADGLPDSWQAKFFGPSPTSWPLPGADTDGDGNSNRDEFLAGTIPTDGSSALRTSLQNTPSGTMLEWNSAPGGLYQIQASEDLVTWIDVGAIHLASGERESMLINGAPVNSYFRVNCLR